MEKFTILRSSSVLIPRSNIDTDQIIPARFLKGTLKSGLGVSLFADWRYLPDGSPNPAFILNQPQSNQSRILLAGDNFGCGSSREHAVWALLDYGFQAIISTSFADIFRNNALKNGLLPVQIDLDSNQGLLELVRATPSVEIEIDLEHQTLSTPDGSEVHFPIDPFARTCLLQGVDELGYLLNQEPWITVFENRLQKSGEIG
jgi:3-isopropylmalate/(R)-2-methylmalate dehydratase small subunit